LDRHNKKVLVIQSYKRFWGFPKGHVEENETMEQCAIRETSEETGISLRETDLLRSYTVYNGDGVYFIVNGNDLSYNLERMTSTEEITGINWLCLRCLDRYMRVNEIIVNSHFRALIPIIRRELYELES
jgi:8-oxo-dGTP pyrophosphatase MutT (NUDIX family)